MYPYLVLSEVEFVLEVGDAVQQSLYVVLQAADLLLPSVQLSRPLLLLMLEPPNQPKQCLI